MRVKELQDPYVIAGFGIYATEAAEFKSYQQSVRVLYPALGLAGEAGEVCEKIKKVYRDQSGAFTPADREAITKELGDVLWYVAAIASDLGISFAHIPLTNLEKLESRKARGTIQGSGDDR